MKVVRLKRDTEFQLRLDVGDGQMSGYYQWPVWRMWYGAGDPPPLPDDRVVIHLPLLFDDMERELWERSQSLGYTKDHDLFIEEVLRTIDHESLHQAIDLCQLGIPIHTQEEMLFRLGYPSPAIWVLASDEDRKRLAKIRDARHLAEYHV